MSIKNFILNNPKNKFIYINEETAKQAGINFSEFKKQMLQALAEGLLLHYGVPKLADRLMEDKARFGFSEKKSDYDLPENKISDIVSGFKINSSLL